MPTEPSAPPALADGSFEMLDQGRVLLARDVGIVTDDGIRLSANIFLPAGTGPFPVLLEHLPYRKDDVRAMQDEVQCTALCRRGVACVRLDVRGTGSSEGVARDEYTVREQLDGVAVAEWIASQPWSLDSVATWGVSYGGFAALQLAARAPAVLGAACAVYASDDRYFDDCHYHFGALAGLENTRYPARMLAMNALPPVRRADEDEASWLQRWRERLEHRASWLERWLDHPHDGPYWQSGSVRSRAQDIRCPVFLVAGWRDGYRTGALRLARELQAPWQLLAGPWSHVLPDRGVPGPAWPFLDELASFVHRHLGSADPREAAPARRPRSVVFVPRFTAAALAVSEQQGDWVGTDRPPQAHDSLRLQIEASQIRPGRAAGPAAAGEAVVVDTPPATGLASGKWCPSDGTGGLPTDQAAEDTACWTWTSEPLDEDVVILGEPALVVRAGPAGARLAVRLCDVAADGSSQLVTRGVALIERAGRHEVVLMATCWRFAARQRIRVCLQSDDWPLLMPGAGIPVEVSGPLALELPLLDPDAAPVETPPVQPLPEATVTRRLHAGGTWRTHEHPGEGGVCGSDATTVASTEAGFQLRQHAAYAAALAHAHAQVHASAGFHLERDGHLAAVRAGHTLRMTSSGPVADLFLHASFDGEVLADRRWSWPPPGDRMVPIPG